jgi:signal transduction histidine kinase
MKKPVHVWLTFAICLLIAMAAMIWLTIKTIELDNERFLDRIAAENARIEAEHQELINGVLWRMDWVLTPIVAQEAARPYYVYNSFYPSPKEQSSSTSKVKNDLPGTVTPSPLLRQPSEYVVLHFQVDDDGNWYSPQFPQGDFNYYAIQCGIDQTAIERNRSKLEQLRTCVDRTTLAQFAPDRMMQISQPNPSQWDSQWSMNFAGNSLNREPNDVFQSSAKQQLDQQLKNGYEQSETNLPDELVQSQSEQVAQNKDYRNRRAQKSLWTRDSAAQNYAQQSRTQQQIYNSIDVAELDNKTIREGVTRPLWIKDKLLLIRRVTQNGKVTIQGCWLDWEKIKEDLNEEISDTFPEARLVPVYDQTILDATNLLATLPVQLAVADPEFVSADVSPGFSVAGLAELSALQLPLFLAWIGLILGSGAVAMLLAGVIRLSERRAAFVSAVTHELRTPLTTFRMYSEMLAEDMVPVDQRKQYTDTLRVEADRLSHLVDNVLQYARLETGKRPKPKELVNICELLDRSRGRLDDRAEHSDMKLSVSLDEKCKTKKIMTDPAAVEQILFNLVDNACKYGVGKKREIDVRCEIDSKFLELSVRDHGPGLNAKYRHALFQPFTKADQSSNTTTAGVGLGLALCRRLAKDLGGQLAYDDSYTTGARFVLRLPGDAGPAGDENEEK